MKKTAQLVAVISLMAGVQSVTAQQQPGPPPPPHEPRPEQRPGMEMDKGAHGGMDEAQMLQHLKMRQEHQLAMHDLSNKILAETDPAKKEALKNQQLELMKAQHMKMREAHPMRRKFQKPAGE